jgi:deaminated glutathione amidase
MDTDGTIAAIQMNSGDDPARNLQVAAQALVEAKQRGARVAVLPENFSFMGAHETARLAVAEDDGRGPVQDFLAQTAQALQLWIVGGTIPLRTADPERVRAACLVVDAQGQRVARYDKIHLFDVDIAREGGGERYRESATIEPGELRAVTVESPVGRLGLSVCYDLRFPELYRALASQGAEILLVPSAFTERTGEAHWEVLLRARAVENQCYLVAPNQCGTHPGGRRTWGQSAIVDPWGTLLAQAGGDAGVIVANLPRARLHQLRESFPVLQHRRMRQ